MKNKNALLFEQGQPDKRDENNVHDLADKGCVPRPFLKWVGGKRALIPQLQKLLPNSIENYLEPFLGGEAMFFYLQNNGLFENAKLSDVNSELIQTWRTAKESPHELLKSLRRHKALHCKEYFYHMRDKYIPRSALSILARHMMRRSQIIWPVGFIKAARKSCVRLQMSGRRKGLAS